MNGVWLVFSGNDTSLKLAGNLRSLENNIKVRVEYITMAESQKNGIVLLVVSFVIDTYSITGVDCNRSVLDRSYSADTMIKCNVFPAYYATSVALLFPRKRYIYDPQTILLCLNIYRSGKKFNTKSNSMRPILKQVE